MRTQEATRTQPESKLPSGLQILHTLFVDDFWIKVMALICAVLIWFFVYGEVTDRTTLDLEIVIWPGGNSLLVEDQSAQKLQMEFQGPTDKIKNLQATEITRPYLIQEKVLGPQETTKTIEIPLSRLPSPTFSTTSNTTSEGDTSSTERFTAPIVICVTSSRSLMRSSR